MTTGSADNSQVAPGPSVIFDALGRALPEGLLGRAETPRQGAIARRSGTGRFPVCAAPARLLHWRSGQA